MSSHRTPKELAESSLYEFLKQAWGIVEPSHAFVPGWHLEGICRHLEAVGRGEIKRLLINIPPGCTKSILTCVVWPAWEWIQHPSLAWLFASYAGELSTRDSVKMRQLIASPWYKANWGDKYRLVDDQNQKTYYQNDKRGWRLATSVDGRGTGEHPDVVVVDDPHNVKQAESELERTSAIEWWDGTISLRGASRGARQVIIMQRLHQQDLSGHVLEKGSFEHICLPMRYETSRTKPTSLGWSDPRTTGGELLCPRMFDLSKVTELERSLGSEYKIAGQFQQRPVPREGLLFKTGNVQIVTGIPAGMRFVRAWDMAATAGDGSFTAGVKIAANDHTGLFYVIDVVRGQWDTSERNRIIRQTAELDGQDVQVWGPQDPGAAGVEAAKAFVRNLAGFSVQTSRPTGSKEVRADPFSSQVNAGNVLLIKDSPDHRWNQAFLDELTTFPMGAFKDQVDAASDAFNTLVSQGDWLGDDGVSYDYAGV